MPNKRYLGDGLYVETCALDWIIVTSEGDGIPTNLVFDIDMVKRFAQIVDEYEKECHDT